MKRGSERLLARLGEMARRSLPFLAFATGLGCFGAMFPAAAAQKSGSFEVSIVLSAENRPLPESAFCRSSNLPGAFGATVTVVCSTGAVVDVSSGESGMPWVPKHGGAYRYLVQVRRADEMLATVDSYTGLGTVTSWRVVQLANREYVELTVGW